MSSIMKQGGVVLAMGKKKMSRAVIQLSLGVDVVGNLLWLAVGVAMGLLRMLCAIELSLQW